MLLAAGLNYCDSSIHAQRSRASLTSFAFTADIDLQDDLRNVNVLYTEGLSQRLMCIAYVWCALHAEQHDTYVLGNVHYLSVWSNAGAVQI